jgi:3-hydroxyisobutyrate dehydrogenase-like beta-hydroxyacid dehydrogenase
MAAGKKAVFDKVKPVLEHLGQTIHYFGKSGNAAAMKLVGNLIVALELEALAEGLVLAQKTGLDLTTVMEVVKVADFRSPLLREQWPEYFETRFFSELRAQAHAQGRGPD